MLTKGGEGRGEHIALIPGDNGSMNTPLGGPGTGGPFAAQRTR